MYFTQINSVLAKWHSYLPITVITQRGKLVWIKIDTSGPPVHQHNSDPTECIKAELNRGYHLPATHQKSVTHARRAVPWYVAAVPFLVHECSVGTCENPSWWSPVKLMRSRATLSDEHNGSHPSLLQNTQTKKKIKKGEVMGSKPITKNQRKRLCLR